ncbi:MAG TPA: hypothetical protein VGP33_04910 [Chloroflexota bacterium]|nr:hypothetical protein [Chloroflexota bacterium]
MDAVIAGQILAGLTALILWRGRARPVPALIPARLRPPTRRSWRDNE